MRDQVGLFLEELRRADLFAAVGKRNCGSTVITVSSWLDAIRISDDENNVGIRTQRQNEIVAQIPYGLFSESWNHIVTEIKIHLEPIIQESVCCLRLDADQQRGVFGAAAWDLLDAGMENEYAEFVNTRFYRDLAQWYLRGHFVCGWDYAEGYFRTIIY